MICRSTLRRMAQHVSFARFGVALLLAPVALQAAAAEEYRLGTMDKLRIRVVEFQTSEGPQRDWSALGGDYLVAPSGNVSLPFVGELPAAGKTTAEVAELIASNLQQSFGLAVRPTAAVELAEFRPIFVAGEALSPGKYPYEPGLTVLKAASLAGGVRRSSDSGQRVERDLINARGSESILVEDRNRLLVRRARLDAEAANKETFEVSPELAKTPGLAAVMADEQSIMTTRTKRLRLQLQATEDLKNLLQSQIVALGKKITSQERQIELSKKEQGDVGALSNRGLVVNSRMLSVERTLAEYESKVLDYETALLQAKQDIVAANQTATDLQNDREAEIAQLRQDIEAKLKENDLSIAQSRSLADEAIARAPEMALGSAGGAAMRYTIIREGDNGPSEMAADENTPVLPGDVVKMALVPLPRS